MEPILNTAKVAKNLRLDRYQVLEKKTKNTTNIRLNELMVVLYPWIRASPSPPCWTFFLQ